MKGIKYITLRTKILVPIIGLIILFVLISALMITQLRFFKNNHELISQQTQALEVLNRIKNTGQMDPAALDQMKPFLSEMDVRLLEELKTASSADAQGPVEQLIENLNKERTEASQSSEQGIDNFIRLLLIYTIAIVPVGIIAGSIFAYKISAPLNKLREAAELIAGGKLNVEIPEIKTRDEAEILSKAFSQMVDSLKHVVSEIITSAQGIGSTSENLAQHASAAHNATLQVAKAIESVARGATEQNSNVSTAVGVIEEVAMGIQQVASGAQEQSKNVSETTDLVDAMSAHANVMSTEVDQVMNSAEESYKAADAGSACIVKTIGGMNKIREAVFATAEKLTGLDETTNHIGEIVQVIDEIAEQTNLLALNAAIEAARAGEQGKGFAVVADEVRKLAERSSKATKEIAELIKNIQYGTRVAVESMENGTKEVQEGVKVTKEAESALNRITEVAGKSKDNIEKIVDTINQFLEGNSDVYKAVTNVAAITEQNKASTEEMAASADNVKNTMQDILSVTQANAAVAEEVFASTYEMTTFTEEIASSADSLSKMSQNLRDMVNRFQL